MWQLSGWIASIVAVAIFAWLAWDFFRVNSTYDEGVLLSSREGVDELFAHERKE